MLQAELPVRASFWYFFPEAEEWRLAIVIPLVDQEGSTAAYSQFQKIAREAGLADKIPVYQMKAMSPKDPIYRSLRKAVRAMREPSGFMFNGGVVNNTRLEQAYIYLLK